MATNNDHVFLEPDGPLPVDRPFTTAEALAGGVSRRLLGLWVADGRLKAPMRGVLHAAQIGEGLDLRLACLRLVVPADAVVTDRTAGWLQGASMILAPNDHLQVPRVSMFLSPGNRLCNSLSASGERTFSPGEVDTIDGVRVTSALRTACDLGRMLQREQGFAAMCAMAKVGGFDSADLVRLGDSRFKGYRGVRTFRGTAPYVDPRPQSAPECVMLLRWRDMNDVPVPVPQVEVPGPDGSYYVDLGIPELKYGAEFDGDLWHGPEQRAHDRDRRAWLRDELGWIIDVFTAANLYGAGQDFERRIRAGLARARRRFGARGWDGQNRSGERRAG